MPTRILIVGAGAIGAFYGSRLATLDDVKVSALCRSNYKAVQKHGFQVKSPKYGENTFKPEFVYGSPDEARKAKIQWHYLLVATKALPDVNDDSALLEDLVGPNTSIVLIQNGLGVEQPYAQRFANAAILSAVTVASAAQPQPGVIQHNRWTRISIGPYLPHLDSGGSGPRPDTDRTFTERATRLVSLLQEAGVADAETYDHAGLQFVRWHKVALNAAMNPSSVLSGGSTNQTMALDPELSRHLAGVMQEVLDTAPRILGRPLPSHLATPERILASTRKNTSGSRPSMWLDWERGSRMEIEVILGNPIRMAREQGLEMPRLQAMYALLKQAQIIRDDRQKQTRQHKNERSKSSPKL
jgi:2-dehydropantoate 2-reductase